MATLAGALDDVNGVGEWVDTFAVAVASSGAVLEAVATRERVASNVLLSIKACLSPEAASAAFRDRAETLLSACRVFMRDRRGIDILLTIEALDQFLMAAEAASLSWGTRGEALKCVINSVYSRPEFVVSLLADGDGVKFLPRLLALAGLPASASWLTLVWKALLVSCDCPKATHALSQSLDAWSLLYSTTCYAVYDPQQQPSHTEQTEGMLIEMLKLVAVLVNEIKWSDGDAAASAAVLQTVHHLGELLLFILGSGASIGVKNRVVEVFMFLPPALTAGFVDTQRVDSPLDSILSHLEAMLVAVRVERSRPVEAMLPVLILCHNLTLAGSPSTISGFFRAAILPPEPAQASRQARRAVFLFTHLQFFLTCLDTDVKRFAGEWLYLLCDQNAEEYTRRTGIGKAIGMLRVKGLA